MITKVKHHPVLTNICLFFTLMALTYSLGFIFSLWWLLLCLPVFTLYIFGWVWADKTALMCPSCNTQAWDKTNYYCSNCGVLLVFKHREKVKKGKEPKPGKIIIPTCSNGHEVWAYDKYCRKCGEPLRD